MDWIQTIINFPHLTQQLPLERVSLGTTLRIPEEEIARPYCIPEIAIKEKASFIKMGV